MKHPDQAEWIAYLYREVDSRTRGRLQAHLAACETCRAQLETWQRVQTHLDAWPLPQPAAKPPTLLHFPQVLRWAAAALVLLAFGFALGRSSGTSSETVAALREELRGELAEIVHAQVADATAVMLAAAQDHTSAALREFADIYQAERLADNQAIANLLTRLDAARKVDYLTLRKDLETVALNSDVGLRQTQQGLVRLADFSQANPRIPSHQP
jgi:anti-sigma factor RsiW